VKNAIGSKRMWLGNNCRVCFNVLNSLIRMNQKITDKNKKGMNKINYVLIFAFLATFMWSCTQTKDDTNGQTPLGHLPDNAAGEVVKKAIEAHGGLKSWNNKKTLSYLKTIQHYDSAGTLSREQEQLHQYQLRPTFKANVSWHADGNHHVIVNNGEDAWQLINGERSKRQEDINQAWNSSFGSHFVIAMPFKLTDPGVNLTDMGTDTLPSGKVARSIKTNYDEGAGSAGGMHTWYYFFDPETNELVANYLDYGDGYSFTDYVAFEKVNGVLFSKKRVSRASDEEMNLAPDSSVYLNNEIKFNVELADSLFEANLQ